MKSYGMLDGSGTDCIREILEDVSNISKEKKCTLYVGEDEAGRIIATENEADGKMFRSRCYPNNSNVDLETSYLGACGVCGDEFFDQAAYVRYTIDEIMPRVHDLFVYGMVMYGSLRFLSEGRLQLADAFNDARRQVARHGRPFILGRNRDGKIMIAPLDRRPEFLEPLACVIGRSGRWTLSDIHSDMYGRSLTGPSNALHEMYIGMGYRQKEYGRFAANDTCVKNLERAFEDAAKMASFYERMSVIISLCGDTIRLTFRGDRSKRGKVRPYPMIAVQPGEFLDDGALSFDMIEAAARNAYDKFLPKYREFMEKNTSGN